MFAAVEQAWAGDDGVLQPRERERDVIESGTSGIVDDGAAQFPAIARQQIQRVSNLVRGQTQLVEPGARLHQPARSGRCAAGCG